MGSFRDVGAASIIDGRAGAAARASLVGAAEAPWRV